MSYQASSPDEIALVSWTENVGLTLIKRDLNTILLRAPESNLLEYEILQLFPFTSETKRMGIIVREKHTDEIVFYLKGADTVMQSIVQYNDWLSEEVANSIYYFLIYFLIYLFLKYTTVLTYFHLNGKWD